MKRLLVALIVLSTFFSSAATASASTKGLSKKVRYWYLHQNGKRDAKLIVLDYRNIKKDYITLSRSASRSAAVAEASVVGNACTKTLQDLAALSTTLKPVPDKKLEKSWSHALSDLKKGAANCSAGASALNANDLNRGSRQLNAASSILLKLQFIRDLFVKTK